MLFDLSPVPPEVEPAGRCTGPGPGAVGRGAGGRGRAGASCARRSRWRAAPSGRSGARAARSSSCARRPRASARSCGRASTRLPTCRSTCRSARTGGSGGWRAGWPTSRRSRTPSAARSTTWCSPSWPARWGAGCAAAGCAPRDSSCARWCRCRSAPRTSAARSATGSPPCAARCRSTRTTRRAAARSCAPACRHLKESKQALGAEVIAGLTGFAPPTLLAQASRLNFSTRLFNLIVTNVPGPQFPLYLLGREMESIVPIAFLPENHAMAVAIMSYNGKLHFGLLGDYDAMGDLERFGRPSRGLPRRAAHRAAKKKSAAAPASNGHASPARAQGRAPGQRSRAGEPASRQPDSAAAGRRAVLGREAARQLQRLARPARPAPARARARTRPAARPAPAPR